MGENSEVSACSLRLGTYTNPIIGSIVFLADWLMVLDVSVVGGFVATRGKIKGNFETRYWLLDSGVCWRVNLENEDRSVGRPDMSRHTESYTDGLFFRG